MTGWRPRSGGVCTAIATLMSFGLGCAADRRWTEDTEGDRQADEIVAQATREMARSLAAIDPGFTADGPVEVVGDSARTRDLEDALEAAGYTVEPEARRTLDYSVVREVGNDGVVISYTLALGGTRLEREYRLAAGGELERGALRVEAVADGVTTASREELDQVPTARGVGLKSALAVGENVALSPATWDEIPEGLMLVATDTVIFERGMTDSEATEGAARRLAAAYDRGTDIIRLVGCSQGRTTAEGGNESLARARSEAMRLSLEKAGLDPAAVVTTLCWAPRVVAPSMPSRGVVIQHLRAALSRGGAR